jgi:ribosomal protein L37E
VPAVLVKEYWIGDTHTGNITEVERLTRRERGETRTIISCRRCSIRHYSAALAWIVVDSEVWRTRDRRRLIVVDSHRERASRYTRTLRTQHNTWWDNTRSAIALRACINSPMRVSSLTLNVFVVMAAGNSVFDYKHVAINHCRRCCEDNYHIILYRLRIEIEWNKFVCWENVELQEREWMLMCRVKQCRWNEIKIK